MDKKLSPPECPADAFGPFQWRLRLRLLYLEPGGWSDEIHCRLVEASFTDALAFEACSYAWGPSRHDRSIRLHGAPGFAVTDNAFDMLRRLRDRQDPRALWVDALCINQTDLQERQQQVACMDLIFSRAIRCIVWLGEGPDGFHQAQSTVIDTTWWQKQKLHDEEQEPLEVLQHIYERSEARWWERLWIVQELVLAQCVEVYFGPYLMGWDDFCDSVVAVQSCCQGGHEIRRFPETKSFQRGALMRDKFNGLMYLRVRRLGTDGGQSLLTVIEETSRSLCSDPQDKIYAILSLLNRTERSYIVPDYTISRVETFSAATYASIVAHSSLAILNMINFRRSGIDLPSWVVDFTSPVRTELAHYSSGSVVLPHSKGTTTVKRHTVTPNDTCNEATIRAILLRGHLFADIRQTFDLKDALPSKIGFWTCCARHYVRWLPLKNSYNPEDFLRMTAWQEISGLRIAQRGKGIECIIAAAFNCWSELVGFGNVAYSGAFINTTHHRDKQSQEILIRRFYDYAMAVSSAVSFFATSSGHIGMAPGTTMTDDSILLVQGERPIVLRRHGEEHTFQGFAYVHGIMDGELRDYGHDFVLKEQDIRIH